MTGNQAQEKPSIHILGPGALGCLWAAHLASHSELTMIARPGKAAYLQFEFLPDREQNAAQSFSLPQQSASDISKGVIHTLLVFTKSDDTLAALESLRSKLNEGTPIILFQNGLGSQFQVIKAFNDFPLLAAVTTEGANKKGKQVIHAGLGKTTLGALNKTGEAHLKSAVQLLSKSGLDVERSDDIWQHLWLKLAINCAINPFTALENCPNGEIATTPTYQQHWPGLKQELVCMLRHAGHPLDPEALESLVVDVRRKTAKNISSMLQDVRQGRRTEIEHINGFAARYLKERGEACRSNLWLWEQVRALGH